MITIYFDGLCYPKTPAAWPAYGYIDLSRRQVDLAGFLAPVGGGPGWTNNVAEYEGLRAARSGWSMRASKRRF